MKDIDSATAADLFAPVDPNHIDASDGNQPPPAAALADVLDRHMGDGSFVGNDDGDDCNEPFASNDSGSGSSSDESGASIAPNADGEASMLGLCQQADVS